MAVGVVFLWFGAVKFVPGLSPADVLATGTIGKLSLGQVNTDLARFLLAVLETAIGLGMILGRFMRLTLLLLFFQMDGTVTPLFLYPEQIWRRPPFGLTMEGQYIVKNIVFIAAGIVVGATVRGGRLIASPRGAQQGMQIQDEER